MPPFEFKYFISANSYISVYFLTERGKVVEFVVKLHYQSGEETHEVVRFDTAHNVVHKDVLLPDGSKFHIKEYSYLTKEAGLGFATDDIEEHFEFYIERFEKWLKERKKRS